MAPLANPPSGRRPNHCEEHAGDVQSKQCAHATCNKQPTYGYDGGVATHCQQHALQWWTRCTRSASARGVPHATHRHDARWATLAIANGTSEMWDMLRGSPLYAAMRRGSPLMADNYEDKVLLYGGQGVAQDDRADACFPESATAR